MRELFEDVDAVQDDSLSFSQSEVASLAERISNRIDGMISTNNRVAFTLDRKAASKVRHLAELEGISFTQMCRLLILEGVEE